MWILPSLRLRAPTKAASFLGNSNLAPPRRGIFMLSCRMLDTETNFAAPRFIGGLPPMPAPLP
jgi:hypothetical protein